MAGRRRDQVSDPIEAEMEVRGRVLHRDKLVARSLAWVMLALSVFFIGASLAYALGWGAQVSPLAKAATFLLAPLGPFVLLTRTVLRTLVTTEELTIRWGLWGPRIPLASLTKVEVVSSEEVRKRQRKQRTHVYHPGHFTEPVWIEWELDGKTQAAVLGSNEPQTLLAAIEEGRRVGSRVAPVEAIAGELDETALEEAHLGEEDHSRSRARHVD